MNSFFTVLLPNPLMNILPNHLDTGFYKKSHRFISLMKIKLAIHQINKICVIVFISYEMVHN